MYLGRSHPAVTSGELAGMPVSRDAWNDEYAKGRWNYLAHPQEIARYAVIASYVARHCPSFRLLDLGCGEGVLASYFSNDQMLHYTGLDLSEVALRKIELPEDKRTLICADVESFEFPDEAKFEAIVLNEVLYYPRRPMAVLERLTQHLSPGGVIVVSMWHSPDPNSMHAQTVNGIWRTIDSGPWKGLDETAVTNLPTRRTWRIRAMTA